MHKITLTMKRLGERIAYWANCLGKVYGNIISNTYRRRLEVKPGRVMCWAYNFKQYGCNPRYLSEYLLEKYPDMEIYWVFRKGVDTSAVDKRIKVVRFKTREYYELLATAEFLVTNSRTGPYRIYWHKRPEQKYLMLWHAGVALKRIEADAEAKLGYSYIQRAKQDSKACDLMISGSSMHTELIKRAFWYDGEILECGIPRNDIFINGTNFKEARQNVVKHFGLDPEAKIVLYAPTFRSIHNKSLKPYSIDWSRMKGALAKMLGSEKVCVIVRLHPNLIGRVDTSPLVAYDNVFDGTLYHDMQELLITADLLITDYSSSMFDFSLMRKPCMLYAIDAMQYDRGYYFSLSELPYPLALSEDELLENIENFNDDFYFERLQHFLINKVGSMERGFASYEIAEWMREHSIKR